MSFKTLGSLSHTTAKAGIIGMTRQLAMEGRDHGIRANSISPGVIETNQTREQLKDPQWAGFMLGKTLFVASAGLKKWPASPCSWRRMTVRTWQESTSLSMAGWKFGEPENVTVPCYFLTSETCANAVHHGHFGSLHRAREKQSRAKGYIKRLWHCVHSP
jgi:NAD(P)-dependent dehydrogenase (short-subunit alcohol dehydrogenase family)